MGQDFYIPRAREHVEIFGRPGTFFVLAVDQETQCADVVSLSGVPYLEEAVPFAEIRPFPQDMNRDGE